jgi:serine/threonine protein kinase
MVIAPDQVVGGKYRLRRRIATGGMGSVWLARHEVLDVDVAVKLMSAATAKTELGLARFEREAKASAQLKSNHIVRVHDYGVDDGTPFMVMELLEGEDLGRRLNRDGPITLAEMAPLFTQICKGLEVAHEAGLVHRDLKPSNVFLAREGNEDVVKLVDFGVARETKTEIVKEHTATGVVVGSPHHMSPEQALGERVDHRSDLWSLGVLLYRCLTGKRPFDGDAMTAVLLAVVSHPIPKASEDNPDLPSEIDQFFRRALNRDAERRFQQARTMAEALAAVAEGKELTPFLSDPIHAGEGREEPTIPSGERVPKASLSSAGGKESTHSRTVGAVTAGVIHAAGLSPRPRIWPWIALVVAMSAGAFFLGRSDGDPVTSAPSATTTEAVPETSEPPTVTTQAATPPPVTSATPSASSGAVATTAPPPVATPVRPPTPHKPPSPKATPPKTPMPTPPPKPVRIDPFTGLPASP